MCRYTENPQHTIIHSKNSVSQVITVPFLQRRCSLEEWITKLLSDIELARSVVVASFLELEAAARSGMSYYFMLLSCALVKFIELLLNSTVMLHFSMPRCRSECF